MHRRSSLIALIVVCHFLMPAFAQSGTDVSIRAELAAPLQEVQRLFREKQFAAALKALSQAEAVANRTEDENILIERLRAATASNAADLDQAAMAYERLIAYPKVAAADRLSYYEVLATLHLRRKAFADSVKAGRQYLANDGRKPSVRMVIAQAALFANDPATTVGQTAELLALARQSGVVPERDILILQANAQQRMKDESGYARTLETLVEFHPQAAYWSDLLGRVQSEPGFPSALLLDLYRLQYASRSLGAGEALEMSQLSIKQGFPLEAVRALQQAAAGQLSPEDSRQVKEALIQAEQLVAADSVPAGASSPASKTGKAGVSASASGAARPVKPSGFSSLYQQWLSDPTPRQAGAMASGLTGDLLTPANRLRLAAVHAQSGQRDEALALLEPLSRGTDAVARLSSLWLLYLKKAGA